MRLYKGLAAPYFLIVVFDFCTRMFRWTVASVSRRSQARNYGYVHRPKPRIPHLLGPSSVWRKCNLVIPTVATLDPLIKYQWLTKSSVIRGLPSRITSCEIDENSLKDVEQRASQTLAFQTRLDFDDKEIASGLLQNMLLPLWKHADVYEHLLNSSLAYQSKIECYWRRNGINYITVRKPAYVFHTGKALELFVDPSFSGNDTLPPVQYTPRSMNMFEHPFNQITVFSGFNRHSHFPFGHTILYVDSRSLSEDQLAAHALVTLFSQAAAQTVQDGHKLDEDLYYPLANQGIFTNGQLFAYFCYQLNTLDLREDTGHWNVFYIGPTMKLFESVIPGEGLKEFNSDCARLFMQFILQKTTREPPEFDGFQLAEQARRKKVAARVESTEKYQKERKEFWRSKHVERTQKNE